MERFPGEPPTAARVIREFPRRHQRRRPRATRRACRGRATTWRRAVRHAACRRRTSNPSRSRIAARPRRARGPRSPPHASRSRRIEARATGRRGPACRTHPEAHHGTSRRESERTETRERSATGPAPSAVAATAACDVADYLAEAAAPSPRSCGSARRRAMSRQSPRAHSAPPRQARAREARPVAPVP